MPRRPVRPLAFDRLDDRSAPAVGVLDVNLTGSGNGDSFASILSSLDPSRDSSSALSADGRFVVFLSNAANVDPTGGIVDIGGFSNRGNVYVRDRLTGTTELISVTAGGAPNGGAAAASGSDGAVITPDGRYVAFLAPKESTLTPSDSIDPLATFPMFPEREAVNFQAYVRDRQTGTSQLVSVSSGRMGGSGNLESIGISDDGRFVVYSTPEGNYGSTDTNEVSDVYIYDRTTGVTKLVSHNVTGTNAGNGASTRPVISGNGKTVLFQSTATNLTSLADTNDQTDLFAYDVATGTISLVTIRADGKAAGNSGGGFEGDTNYRIDDNGRHVLFGSRSTDLRNEPGYDFFFPRLFVRDLSAGTTTLVGRKPDGTPADVALNASLSRDGRYVAFRSNEPLNADANDGKGLIYLLDRQTGSYTLVSHDPAGTPVEGYSPVVSADGRYVAYTSGDTGIAAGVGSPSGAKSSVYVYDRLADRSVAVTTNANGTQTVDTSFGPVYALSRNGQTIIISTDIDGALFGLVDNNQTSTPNANNLYDNAVPFLTPLVAKPTIAPLPGQADPTNAVIHFKVAFNGQVTGFTGTDISFQGSTVGGAPVSTVTGGNQFYTVTVTGMTGEGEVVVSIQSGAAVAPDGSPSLAAPANGRVRFDGVIPTVAVAPDAGQADPTDDTIIFTVTFSETVNGFDVEDLDFSGSTVTTGVPVISGTGAKYLVTVPPGPGRQTGVVSLNIKANGANDNAGNPNAASASAAKVRVQPADIPASLVGFPQFLAGSDKGSATVTFYDSDGSKLASLQLFPGFTGGIRTAAADFNNDGVADIIAGTGPGRATRVVVLDGVSQKQLFAVDPFEASFTGGVYVAAGDVNGDGVPDLAITPDEGGGPRVDMYSGNGFAKIVSFFGIDDVNFRGGARASVADMTGDGVGDLIVVAGFGGGPRVAAFDGTTLSKSPEKIFGDFFAFEQTLRNGIFVTAGDLNGDGFADLIAGGGPGGGPRVLVFDGKNLLSNQYVNLANFFGGDPNSRGGIRMAVKDLDGDNRADLVVGSGSGAGSRVTTYLGKNIAPAGTPPAALDFDSFAGFTGGVFVG